ncbi:hypothetical protein [Sphingopyxis sp. 113P3]|uniref:hypothetical protein n=1 Tax=Sphingopyxis sp. (strain 113P3) TaxID=292913 RepID=UPI00191115C1|nr:hypothetical protein [Sphingopyxis sp. 113P3]
MREYLWRRRQAEPDRELWRRAKKRAADRGLPFDLSMEEVVIPSHCPVLGIELRCGEGRGPGSPSLDRIEPELGYISGNVRVISDKANRMKGRRDHASLVKRSQCASGWEKVEFLMIAEYVRRELLLKEVRRKARSGGGAKQWKKVEEFLEAVFSRGQLVDVEEVKKDDVVEPVLTHDMMSF